MVMPILAQLLVLVILATTYPHSTATLVTCFKQTTAIVRVVRCARVIVRLVALDTHAIHGPT
mgnify:CR=1 FL=1